MIFTTSWDDGDILDERVADMLDDHGLRGTFYIARSHRPNRLPEPRIRTLAGRHEIGAHTLNHLDLTRLDAAAKRNEIAGSKDWLEDVTGMPVDMFCYPLGEFDAETREIVVEAGFRGARTIRQFSLTPDPDRFAMRTTLQVHPTLLRPSTLGDFGIYLLGRNRGPGRANPALRTAAAMVRGWPRFAEVLLAAAAGEEASVFHLWGHSWEIEETGMWAACNTFLRSLSRLEFHPRSNGDICRADCGRNQ